MFVGTAVVCWIVRDQIPLLWSKVECMMLILMAGSNSLGSNPSLFFFFPLDRCLDRRDFCDEEASNRILLGAFASSFSSGLSAGLFRHLTALSSSVDTFRIGTISISRNQQVRV